MKKGDVFLLVIFALMMIGFVGGMETADEIGIPLLGALISLVAMALTVFKIKKDKEDEE